MATVRRLRMVTFTAVRFELLEEDTEDSTKSTLIDSTPISKLEYVDEDFEDIKIDTPDVKSAIAQVENWEFYPDPEPEGT